jgi:hypothetical protein
MVFSQPRPGALLWQGGCEAVWLRRPETVDDVLALESTPKPLVEEP